MQFGYGKKTFQTYFSIFLKTAIRNVPEVLNVHVNENNKKNRLFLEGFFFSNSEKSTFEK